MAATTDGAAVRDIFDSKQHLFGSSVKKFSFVINSQIVTPNESISVLPTTADKHIINSETASERHNAASRQILESRVST